MAWDDINQVPWLIGPDAASFLNASVNAGQAVSHNFLTARQQAMQQQEQDALLPLKQQEIANHVANSALDLQLKQEAVNDALTSKEGIVALMDVGSRITDWSDTGQTGELDKVAQQFPNVPRSSVWHDYEGRRKNADILNARLAQSENLAEQRAADRASREKQAEDKNATTLNAAMIGQATRQYSSDNRVKIEQMILGAKDQVGKFDSKVMERAATGEIHALTTSLTGKMMSPEEFGGAVDKIVEKYKGKSPGQPDSRETQKVSIQDDFKSGKITRDQAVEALKRLGYPQ